MCVHVVFMHVYFSDSGEHRAIVWCSCACERKGVGVCSNEVYLSEECRARASGRLSTCVLPGTLVPSATIDMAVTESLRLMVQPKWLAMSPMSAVKNPMPSMDTTKHDQPPCRSVEGVSGCAGHVSTADYRLYTGTYRQLIMGEKVVSRKHEEGDTLTPANGWEGGSSLAVFSRCGFLGTAMPRGEGGVLCSASASSHSWWRQQHEAALEGQWIQH